MVFACLIETSTDVDNKYFDHRYFYRDIPYRICHCTCGLARKVGARLIHERRPDLFLSNKWINSLDSCARNPAMLGFAVEQVCLSFISQNGFSHVEDKWNPKSAIFFSDLLTALPTETSSAFLVPTNPNFKYIDALHIDINKDACTLSVAPIQITINPKHADSETLFYHTFWEPIRKRFPNFKLSSTFIWIVEEMAGRAPLEHVEECSRLLRSGTHVVVPSHKRVVITLDHLYPILGERLANVRGNPVWNRNNPLSVGFGHSGLLLSREMEVKAEKRKQLDSVGIETGSNVVADAHHPSTIVPKAKKKAKKKARS
jgi:hypothetical protein